MISRKTIALSFAAILVSASAAMAATTHPTHGTHHRADVSDEARSSYAAEPRWQDSYAAEPRQQRQGGLHYYEGSDNGSVWSFYPGYVPTARY
jgi:hypothetical protein